MKKTLLIVFYVSIIACTSVYIPKSYRGTAFKTQSIPGKIECELYDRGGEGIAYHDSDALNNGSGKLNPANGTYLNEFRMNEGVDISYTKSNNIDNNPFNKTIPLLDHLYVGWTVPGEWINYSINVKKSGVYKIAAMYTANGDGAISFDIDNKPATGELKIPSTHNDADTVAWRQWHHWNRVDSLTSLKIAKGKHLITLHIVQHGQMNFDYFEFARQ
jgi:carbohydrate binding protein with CBM6 domain